MTLHRAGRPFPDDARVCRIVARSNADLQRVIDQIVGYEGIRRAHTIIALAELIPANSGWDLQTTSAAALGISDNGIIVGRGELRGLLDIGSVVLSHAGEVEPVEAIVMARYRIASMT